jgi:hypothetical protein
MKIIAPKRLMESVFPTVRNGGIFNASSLDLQFARTKTLDSRITFTRASSGTFVGSDGVIRTAVTNLLLRSEEFDNASWNSASGARSVTADSIAAPNGLTVADTVTADGTNAPHFVSQSVTVTAQSYAFSVFAKKDTEDVIYLRAFVALGQANVGFNLTSGTVVAEANGGVGRITAYPNGWYRCTMIFTPLAATGNVGIYVKDVVANTGSGSLHLWGAQLEQSPTVGEYIPTTSTINSAPRFDHNPTTGESLGLLVEEQRTNLLLQSENITTTWTNFNSTDAGNTAASPDGANTADTLIPDNGVTNGLIRQDVSGLADSTTYTFSVFLKAAGLTNISAQFYSKSNTFHGSRMLNTSDGTFSGSDSVGVSSVIAYPSGWYRLILTNLGSGTGATTPTVRLVCTSTGNGTSGVYVWGAQLEAGAFPTSYIPTTTATVTRSADVASITGTNFSSWYRQDEGTVFVRAATFSPGTVLTHAISGGTFNESIYANFSGGNSFRGANVLDAGVGQANSISTFTGLIASVGVNDALAFQADNFGESLNGLATRTDNTGTIPTVDRLFIGSNWTGNGSFLNGTIKRLTYWPQRLSNSTLQQITQ